MPRPSKSCRNGSDQKQQIISRHMDILLNLKPVVSNSAKALRHLYDRVEGNIRGLKSLGVDSGTYGSLLYC